MMPGGPRNQREMQQMMRKLGMTNEPVPDVEEVVVRTRTTEHVLSRPEVSIITVQGVRTYQVVGEAVVRPRSATAPASAIAAPAQSSGPPEEDVRLVMEQANVSREEALEALFQSKGEPAEAIMKILSRGR
jgi:nascent polypeptide-associated complex subunit alpha